MSPIKLLAKAGFYGQHAARNLARALGISRFQAYGLLKPSDYPPPTQLFDSRHDLAERVAKLAKTTAGAVRDYYAKRARKVA